MKRPRIISAIGTPLHPDGRLHEDGLRLHLTDHWDAGIDSVLVGGTMGLMQMLTDAAYRALVEQSVACSAGRGELLVGVGDTSLPRTLDRVGFVNGFDVDGVVVLSPHFLPVEQGWLVEYYHAVADAARAPVLLYDLPPIVGYALEADVICAAAEHPNIIGIKCSGPIDTARQLQARLGDGFRIVLAQPMNIDAFVRVGFHEFLDGVFALAPSWMVSLADAIEAEDWDRVSREQRRLTELLVLLRQDNPFRGFSLLMNQRGVPGQFVTSPIAQPTQAMREALLRSPVVEQLLAETSLGAAV